MIRLGLIGAGRWGRNYISTIAALDSVRLVRLASRNPASRGLVGPECEVGADWRQFIDAGNLDGVIIATPPALHADMTIAVVAAGIPVLVEKPLTLGLNEAIALRDRVHARNGLVMVDHTHLFHPAFEELKLRVPRLGTIRAIEADAGDRGPYRDDVPVLWDWGPHDIAMCLDLLRELPRDVSATREAHERVRTAETVRLDLTFGDGLRARITLSNMKAKTRRFAIHCDDGLLIYDDLVQDKLVLHQGVRGAPLKLTSGMPITISPEPPLRRVVKAFVTAITEGSDRTSSLDLAVDVVAVLDRCSNAFSAR